MQTFCRARVMAGLGRGRVTASASSHPDAECCLTRLISYVEPAQAQRVQPPARARRQNRSVLGSKATSTQFSTAAEAARRVLIDNSQAS